MASPNPPKRIILRKKAVFIISDFKIYYKAVIIKALWYQYKKALRQMRQNMNSRNKYIYL